MKARTDVQPAGTVRPVYFISDRPEAYEYWSEIGPLEARQFARTIVEHAARRFPKVEFRIDSEWHSHDPALDPVAAYIDSHWQRWAAETADGRQTA